MNSPPILSRRDMLRSTRNGFGYAAFADLVHPWRMSTLARSKPLPMLYQPNRNRN